MVANESVPKDAVLDAIREIPDENLSMDAIFHKMLQLFQPPSDAANPRRKKAGAAESVRHLFIKYFSGKQPDKTKKPVDPETYRQNLLNLSVWSEADLDVFEENRKHFNNWSVESW
ncbi:MAG: hypothetical protein ACKVUS_14340 [Saprospiraceae bacterium]